MLGASPEDAAVLKEVGLTSDEGSGDDGWGSSGEEDKGSCKIKDQPAPQDLSLGTPEPLPDSRGAHECACHGRCMWLLAVLHTQRRADWQRSSVVNESLRTAT